MVGSILNFLLNLAFVLLVYGFIIALVIGIIAKIVQKIRSIKHFFSSANSQAKIIERNNKATSVKMSKEERQFLWAQDGVLKSFILDRELGVHYVWTNREEGLITVYTSDQKAVSYYVEFAGIGNEVEILTFKALDGSFHYAAMNSREKELRQGLKLYYNGKVTNDNEYRNTIQNALLNNAGEAMYDAKRYNDGNPLPPDHLGYVMEALESYDYDIIKADYEESIIYLRLKHDVQEADIPETAKQASLEEYYKDLIKNDKAYNKQIINEIIENGGDTLYDAKRLNEGNVLPKEELDCIMKILETKNYVIQGADYEKSTINIGLYDAEIC